MKMGVKGRAVGMQGLNWNQKLVYTQGERRETGEEERSGLDTRAERERGSVKT